MSEVNVFVDGSLVCYKENHYGGVGIVIIGDDLRIQFFNLMIGNVKNSTNAEKSAIKQGIKMAKKRYENSQVYVHSDCLSAFAKTREIENVKIVQADNKDVITKFFMRKAHNLSRKASFKSREILTGKFKNNEQ